VVYGVVCGEACGVVYGVVCGEACGEVCGGENVT